jgi:hypothetical protein
MKCPSRPLLLWCARGNQEGMLGAEPRYHLLVKEMFCGGEHLKGSTDYPIRFGPDRY